MQQAPGVLAFPGGKVEVGDGPDSVLEAAVRCEIREETGVTVAPELKYVRSMNFTMGDGTEVVDVLFHGAYQAGEPEIVAGRGCGRPLDDRQRDPGSRKDAAMAQERHQVRRGG